MVKPCRLSRRHMTFTSVWGPLRIEPWIWPANVETIETRPLLEPFLEQFGTDDDPGLDVKRNANHKHYVVSTCSNQGPQKIQDAARWQNGAVGECFVPQQRKLMGSSPHISSGEVPEGSGGSRKVPVCVGAGSGGRFRKVSEGYTDGYGRFRCVLVQVPEASSRQFQKVLAASGVCSRHVPESSGKFRRVLMQVPEGGSGGFRKVVGSSRFRGGFRRAKGPFADLKLRKPMRVTLLCMRSCCWVGDTTETHFLKCSWGLVFSHGVWMSDRNCSLASWLSVPRHESNLIFLDHLTDPTAAGNNTFDTFLNPWDVAWHGPGAWMLVTLAKLTRGEPKTFALPSQVKPVLGLGFKEWAEQAYDAGTGWHS